MKNNPVFLWNTRLALILSFFITSSITNSYASPNPRKKININANWRYKGKVGELSDPAPGSEDPAFNDASWEVVGIPHSFNDMSAFSMDKAPGSTDPGFLEPFNNKKLEATVRYRKHFTLSPEFASQKTIYIEFEGVSQQADVWLNGEKLGMHVGSSVPFVWDITDKLNFGNQKNVLAVKVANTQEVCKGVPGAMFWTTDAYGGIVRDVWLHIVDKVHIPINVYSFQETWGTYAGITNFTASPEFTMETQVKNSSSQSQDCKLITELVDDQGAIALTLEDTKTIASQEIVKFVQKDNISNPRLWSPESPNLYTIKSTVIIGGNPVDLVNTPFGIRKIHLITDKPEQNGVYFNDQKYIVRGFGIRQTNYPALANAVSNYMHEKDIRLVKEAGGTMIRGGHGAMDPALMDACDRYGIAIISPSSMSCEAGMWGNHHSGKFSTNVDPVLWEMLKKEYTRDIVIRDRNHPSVMIWELENIALPGDQFLSDKGVITTSPLSNELAEIIRQLDHLQTRPIGNGHDVQTRVQLQHPHQFSAGYFSLERGWSSTGLNQHRLASHQTLAQEQADLYRQDWITNFSGQEKVGMLGLAVWTLYETCGENFSYGIGGSVPNPSAPSTAFGVLDANGRIPKETYNMYKTIWSKKPSVYTSIDWSGSLQNIIVFTSDQIKYVELFIDSKSQGIKDVYQGKAGPWQASLTRGNIPIKAVGKSGRQGAVLATHTQTSYGPAAGIELIVDPPVIIADGGDAVSIYATIVDDQGNWCQDAELEILFSVSTGGNYRGAFLHNSQDPRNDNRLDMKTEMGKMSVAIRSTQIPSTVNVTATSPGLKSGSVSFKTIPGDSATHLIDSPSPSSFQSSPFPQFSIVNLQNNHLSLRYTIPHSGNTDLVIVNLVGKRVQTVHLGNIKGKNRLLNWEFPNHLAKGFYLVMLKTGQYRLVKKAMLVR